VIRWTLLFVGAVLLGGIVHFASIIILPQTATRDAYSRLQQVTKTNTVEPLNIPTASQPVMPFMDPAFATAICRYDLSHGPMKLSVPVGPAYTSISFYTRYNIAYYVINDQAAGRRVIELNLMTEEQHGQLPEEENVTAADRLIVDSPTVTGLIAIRALAPDFGSLDKAMSAVAGAKCQRTDITKASN
jgi:uncharacterized membrane protein